MIGLHEIKHNSPIDCKRKIKSMDHFAIELDDNECYLMKNR